MSPQTLHTRPASISPVTSQAARDAGLTIAAEAAESTWDGLLAAIQSRHPHIAPPASERIPPESESTGR